MSTNDRYLLASNGIVLYSIESEKYTRETTFADFKELGYTNEDIDPPNENPQTPMPTGGVDGPYANSPDPREHSFDATTVPVNTDAPLELAFGSRATSTVDVDSDGTPDYEEHLFTVERPLPTATIKHIQTDANLEVDYSGCKASVTISWSMGDPVNFDWSITAAEQHSPEDWTDTFSSDIDSSKQPYKSHMQGTITVTDNNGLNKEIATVTGGEIGIDNGLEVNHHGDGREAYSVSEETNAERFTDHTLDVKPTDKELFERAAENDEPVDVEIPFVRTMDDSLDGGTITDGIILTLTGSPITEAAMPYQAEGSLETTIGFQPLSLEAEMRTPL